MRFITRHTASALLLAVLLALPVVAQEAAKLVPANAAVFIEINDLAALRKEWASDPLAQFMRENLPLPEQAGWTQVQKVMGMTGDEIIDRFFGTTAAMVVFNPGEDPGLVLSKVSDADAAILVEKLQLKPVGQFAGYAAYQSPDEKSHIAIGKGWVIVAQPRYGDAARAILEGREKSLADSDLFKTWTDKLPKDRVATVFVHHDNDQQIHAMRIARKGRNLTLEYRGKSPELSDMLARLGNGKSLDFGPLPMSTIAAVTANLAFTDTPGAKPLNRVFPGKSFQKDILPKLGAPMIAFMGAESNARYKVEPPPALPVVGVGIKLRDAAVADDLTSAINSLMVVANFAAAKWEAPLVQIKELTYEDTKFRSANIGDALAHRAGRDEIKPMTLTYGRIGQWYIICTQDQFFRQCIDTNLDPSRSTLVTSRAFTTMPLVDHEGPVLSAVLRPRALVKHIDDWLTHWNKARPEVVQASKALVPATAEAQLVRAARIAAGLLDHYQSMSLQAYRDGDGVAAHADVVRK